MPDHAQQAANPFYKGYFKSEELLGMGFKSVGENVKIAKNCTIVGLDKISLGNNIQIDENVFIAANAGPLHVGDYVHIGGGSHLNCAGGITLSDFCGLSQGVRIYSATDDYTGFSLTNSTVPEKFKSVKIAPVFLGRHVIIGSGCVILHGVNIGIGSSVGALSLVHSSLQEWGVYFGSPAKRIKARSQNLLELERQLISEKKVNPGRSKICV
jgi:acetyltransferase-like isoleucine patch superfamily enzyme